jgi:CDP-diacylglycerol--glycerol-3-phosphate 3-phosphatidyltransferase
MWWRVAVLLGFIVQLIGFTFIAYFWHFGYAWRWVSPALIINAYILVVLKNGLSANHRTGDSRLLPDLGIGNWITVFRVFLIAMLAGFLFLPCSDLIDTFSWLAWLPGSIYLTAAILDYFDGFAARLTHHQTRLGEALDTKADALGLLIGILVAIKIGQLPLYYISVGSAYFVVQMGIWFRATKAKPLIELKPYPQARLMAGLQMGFVSVTLFPILKPPITTLAAIVFMIPFLLGFLRDWLVICGHIQTDACQRASWENKLYRSVTRWFPLILRGFIGITGFAVATRTYAAASGLTQEMASQGLFFRDFMVEVVFILLVIFVVLGLMGRISAILLGVLSGYLIIGGMHGMDGVVLFIAACCLMITGSGVLSIWTPEERIVMGNRYPDDTLQDCGQTV